MSYPHPSTKAGKYEDDGADSRGLEVWIDSERLGVAAPVFRKNFLLLVVDTTHPFIMAASAVLKSPL